MKIHKFTFNPFFENTYIIWDEETLTAAVIDPGMSEDYEEDEIKTFIDSNGLKVNYMINTHCHIDHILGTAFIKEKYNPLYLLPERDLPLYENAQTQANMFGIEIKKLPAIDNYLSEAEDLLFGSERIKCIHTPGHSPGEFCLNSESSNFCITGDVLFRDSIGRTDLYGGNFDQLIESIKTKLLTLHDDVVIYPGHGDKSTIGYEKQHNPFLV
ncbi:MAG: MBL fold metallo-hydrolase [Ignavibacteria bacterium]|jgi:glyoxylase-like metal-dependent hydrolase (beta-lactamase superfamily II)